MNDLPPPPAGHNNPPEEIDPREAIVAPYAAFIEEATNWLDGIPVENEDQMKAVDGLSVTIKAVEKTMTEARDAATKPLHDAWKSEIALWKPYLDDLERIKKGLAKIVSDFKVKLAREREEEARKKREEAARLAREAEEARAKADVGNIESMREAEAANRQAIDAKKEASAANKEVPKGLVTVWKWAFIGDDGRRLALNWIARNDRDAMTAFIEDYVARNHRNAKIDGVNSFPVKEAR